MAHTKKINKLIHEPSRLKIMSALIALDKDAEVDFTFLRNQLKLTDGNLGGHLEKLQTARYIRARKTFVKRKPRTFVSLTRLGRRAFEDHVEQLKKIIG
ncbi:MAG: transcriptional regulator [Phycisphaerae bacterium]|nr:transcriptional regulator [Phycisphaerae bacterium]